MTFVLTTTSDICSSFFFPFFYMVVGFVNSSVVWLMGRSFVLNRDYVMFSHSFRINLGINHVS